MATDSDRKRAAARHSKARIKRSMYSVSLSPFTKKRGIRIMNKELTKLKIRVVRPPISIFEMVEGKEDIDRTEYYEHGWSGPDKLFWMVPDGTYLCTQGDQPCVYEVSGGKITRHRVTKAPIGNTVEELIEPKKPEPVEGVTLADIMHVHNSDQKDKKHKK